MLKSGLMALSAALLGTSVEADRASGKPEVRMVESKMYHYTYPDEGDESSASNNEPIIY